MVGILDSYKATSGESFKSEMMLGRATMTVPPTKLASPVLHVIQVIIAAVLVLEETVSCAWALLYATFASLPDVLGLVLDAAWLAVISDVLGTVSSISDILG